jgi:hypothetical protein
LRALLKQPKRRQPSLQDASAKAVQAFTGVSATGNYLQLRDGRFLDDRWVGGRWDLSKFAAANGETDWDAVSGRAAWLARALPSVHWVVLP